MIVTPTDEFSLIGPTPPHRTVNDDRDRLVISRTESATTFPRRTTLSIYTTTNTDTRTAVTASFNAFIDIAGPGNLTNDSVGGGRMGVTMRTEANAATITQANGNSAIVSIENGATGTILKAVDFYAEPIDAEDGTIVNAIGFYSAPHIVDSGTLNNAYGLYLEEQTNGDTSNWQIYSAGGKSNLTTGTLENNKFKLTAIGGYAIKLTNKTGSNSVAGQLVTVYTATSVDDAFRLSDANGDNNIGIVLDSGVADGSDTWVVTGGIADVLMDSGGSARGDRIISSATAGSADVWNVGGAVATHFLEIGHCLETRTGAGLARCIIHFN